LTELKLNADIFISNNQNISSENQEDFSKNAKKNILPSNNQKAGFPNSAISNIKNLNLFLPKIENSYFANHIQEVLNPISDDTSNYSNHNINNDIDFSDGPEQLTDFDNKRINPIEKFFENNINYSINNFNYFSNNTHNNNNAFSAKKQINSNQKIMGLSEADSLKFHNYNIMKMQNSKNNNLLNNTEMDNAELVDFKNLNNPSNNFLHQSQNLVKYNRYDNPKLNINMNNYNNNDEYMFNKNAENLRAENNYSYQGESSSKMMYPNKFIMPNNLNNCGRQFNPVNNFAYNNSYKGMNKKSVKVNSNSMGFNDNIHNHDYNNISNNFNLIPNNISNMNPNLIMNKANKNFPIGNISVNPNNNFKYNTNLRANQNLLMENSNINLNSNNKNFKAFVEANGNFNNNNNYFNMQANSPLNNTIDHNTMLNMKLNKNISNYTELSNDELARNVLVISKDQIGCRFIQKKISENPDFSNNYLFPYVII
jgi:hypothetical protein